MVPPVLTWDVQGVKARVQTLPAASGFIMTKLGVTSVNESWGANLKRNQNFDSYWYGKYLYGAHM